MSNDDDNVTLISSSIKDLVVTTSIFEDDELLEKVFEIIERADGVIRSDDSEVLETLATVNMAMVPDKPGFDYTIYVDYTNKNSSKNGAMAALGADFMAEFGGMGGLVGKEKLRLSVGVERQGLGHNQITANKGKYIKEKVARIEVEYDGVVIVTITDMPNIKKIVNTLNDKYVKIQEEEKTGSIRKFMEIDLG